MHEQSLFSVSDPVELLALWRLVAEAKFQPDPEDTDLWGSPHVHALARRISDALLSAQQAQGNVEAVRAHLRWVASLPNNVALPVIKANLRKDASSQWWSAQSHEQKLAYVEGCVAPFQTDGEFLEGLVREAEA